MITGMNDNRVSIPSTIREANYRYRMPRMILRVESSGNGVKTNITNLVKVAEALDANPDCTTELIHRHHEVFCAGAERSGTLPHHHQWSFLG